MENKITHEGTLDLSGIQLPCYVLEDGTRVLSGRGMQDALKLVSEGDRTSGQLSKFISQKSLNKFIIKDNNIGINPIICYKGNQKINGYEATILVDICDGILEARKQIELTARQKMVANQCEILVRAFAKVGIISLVDEATGYQYQREHFELQKILNAYISDEILKWQLTFTDEFYKEIFRLWGIPYTPQSIKRKPMFIGKLTTKYVYDLLPNGVVTKIKQEVPKSEKGNYIYRWHQKLTPEVGKEHLKKQIIEVTTLMSISESKEQFNSLFKQKYNKQPVQLELAFMEQVEEPKLSNFNQSLKKALDYNSKEKPSR